MLMDPQLAAYCCFSRLVAGPGHSVPVPAVTLAYHCAKWEVIAPDFSAHGRVPVRLTSVGQELASDYRYPPFPLAADPADLQTYRSALVASVWLLVAAQRAAGVTLDLGDGQRHHLPITSDLLSLMIHLSLTETIARTRYPFCLGPDSAGKPVTLRSHDQWEQLRAKMWEVLAWQYSSTRPGSVIETLDRIASATTRQELNEIDLEGPA